LSRDHKPTDEDEIERITNAGGFVVMGRVNGMLAVTRSLGDRAMKDFVSGEPHLTETVLNDDDTHLILACDGVWDVIEDDEAVELVSKFEKAQEAAKHLLVTALKKGSTDNISVIVVKL
jgi:protein phosphatase PTC1